MKKIGIIGSGKVASHISKVLTQNQCQIVSVFSRNRETGSALAKSLNAQYISLPDYTQEDMEVPELILIMVNDDQVSIVAEHVKVPEGTMVAHTSGSVGLDVLNSISGAKTGIFYPLQTFSDNRTPAFSEIPILIESDDADTKEFLTDIARSITSKIRYFNAEQRKIIHLAAVFTNNFTNQILSISEQILDKNGIDRDILYPLADETIAKARQLGAANAQTGPAVRNDQKVLDRHMEMLENNPEWQALYKLLTNMIRNSS